MKPKRPGRRDSTFDAEYPCPKCKAPLDGLTRLQMIDGGMGAMMLPPRFPCAKCGTTWELADDARQKGAHKLPSGLVIVPVETGEQN